MSHPIKLLLVPLLLIHSVVVADENNVTTRVVGGEDSLEGDWPWMVTVYAGNYLCGGSLIAQNTVLTAAHCLYDSNDNAISANDVVVIIGEFNRTSISLDSVRYIASTYIHYGYDPDPSVSSNDIALLELSSDYTESAPLDRLDLATTVTAIADKSDATVLGWGSTVGYAYGESVTPSYPSILQQATLPLRTNSQCKASYGNIYSSSTMLCAGEDEGGTDSCQGDSGGPLIYNNGGNWEQIGIVSFGSGCANAGYPGVYVRLAYYNDWIEDYFNGIIVTSNASSQSSNGGSSLFFILCLPFLLLRYRYNQIALKYQR